jgi:hypothetical protein
MHHDVNQLKGSKIILITCNNCQKIKDDKGNWYERSGYRADYQGVLFGYTLCHECAIIKHAEFYKGTQPSIDKS